METHVEGKIYVETYTGYKFCRIINGTRYGDKLKVKMYRESYSVWRLIQMVQCRKFHIEGTIYGITNIGYNLSRLIKRVQCVDTYRLQCVENSIEVTMYGDSNRRSNVCRLLYRVQCM